MGASRAPVRQAIATLPTDFEELEEDTMVHKIPAEELPKFTDRDQVNCKDISGKNATEINFKEIIPKLKDYKVEKKKGVFKSDDCWFQVQTEISGAVINYTV